MREAQYGLLLGAAIALGAFAPVSSATVVTASLGDHTCGMTPRGGLICWGVNVEGQLGNGTTVSNNEITRVLGISEGAREVAAGSNHTCAAMADSRLMCWGLNDQGQLGLGDTNDRSTPQAVAAFSGVPLRALAAGGSTTCVATGAGALFCWGDNQSGQLGIGDTSGADRLVPTAVPLLGTGVVDVAVGNGHACAVLATGATFCWGDNTFGQVGDVTNMPAAVGRCGADARSRSPGAAVPRSARPSVPAPGHGRARHRAGVWRR